MIPELDPRNDGAPVVVINAGSRIRNASQGWTNTYEAAQRNARKWFDTMLGEGFADIELLDMGDQNVDGHWLFKVRHTVTEVEVDLYMHGVDDEVEFERQNYARPRVYWNDSSCANPKLEDFAAEGFTAVKTFRR